MNTQIIRPPAYHPWLHVKDFGRYKVDIGNSINLALAALPATGGTIMIPASATPFPLNTQISIDKECQIIGMGRAATIIEKQSDVDGIVINTATAKPVLRDFTLDSDGSDAGKMGIQITEWRRGELHNIAVLNQSSNGIVFYKGNCSTFSDIMVNDNGNDGFKVAATDINCNACVFKNIDGWTNGNHGFYMNHGNENWLFGITMQGNTCDGVRFDDAYANVAYIYSETNTGDDVHLTANAKANWIHAGIPSAVVDNGTGNLIWSRGGVTDFMQMNILRLSGSAYIEGTTSVQHLLLASAKKIHDNSLAGAFIRFGTATPENVVTAPVGSMFLRTDGDENTTLYIKETGVGNTGWVAK